MRKQKQKPVMADEQMFSAWISFVSGECEWLLALGPDLILTITEKNSAETRTGPDRFGSSLIIRPGFRCSGVPVFRCSGVPVFQCLWFKFNYTMPKDLEVFSNSELITSRVPPVPTPFGGVRKMTY